MKGGVISSPAVAVYEVNYAEFHVDKHHVERENCWTKRQSLYPVQLAWESFYNQSSVLQGEGLVLCILANTAILRPLIHLHSLCNKPLEISRNLGLSTLVVWSGPRRRLSCSIASDSTGQSTNEFEIPSSKHGLISEDKPFSLLSESLHWMSVFQEASTVNILYFLLSVCQVRCSEQSR